MLKNHPIYESTEGYANAHVYNICTWYILLAWTSELYLKSLGSKSILLNMTAVKIEPGLRLVAWPGPSARRFLPRVDDGLIRFLLIWTWIITSMISMADAGILLEIDLLEKLLSHNSYDSLGGAFVWPVFHNMYPGSVGIYFIDANVTTIGHTLVPISDRDSFAYTNRRIGFLIIFS